jgi:hypothetical protein
MKCSPGSEIEHGYIPIDVEWKHRLSKQISHNVIPGKAAHRSCELAGHHGGMFTVHDAGSHIAGGKDVCRTNNTHEMIHMQATEPIPLDRHRLGHRACPHARAPHDRPRRDHFTGAQRDAACIDGSDRYVKPRFHTQRRQRFADDRARLFSDRLAHDGVWIDENDTLVTDEARLTELAWHLCCDFDAVKPAPTMTTVARPSETACSPNAAVRIEPNSRRA